MSELAFYEDGLTDAPAVVLGHSLGSDHRVWDEVTAALSGSWRIIRWEMPGHGESRRLTTKATMSHLVDQVLAGLDQIGVSEFHAGGISLGGMVSLALAQREEKRVLSLAMFDSGPALPPPEPWLERAQQVREQGMASLADATMDRWFTPEFREGPNAGRYLRTLEAFLACDPEGYAQCCEIIASTDLRPKLSRVRQPTLLLTGDQDAGMTPGQAEDLAQVLPGARGLFEVVAPSRHMTCVEHPQVVAAALATSLERAG